MGTRGRYVPTWQRRSLVVLAAGLLASTSPALAQDTAAVAEKLFEEGRTLMQQGELARACPKLAESHRLDPGVGTLLNLAECYERQGKTASAWATYREAEDAARRASQRPRMLFAAQRARALEPKLAYLVIVADDRPELTVTRDGVSVSAVTFGTELPVDPGSHAVEVRAPGYLPFRTTVDVEEGGRARVVVPALAPAPTTAERPAAPPPPRSSARGTHAVISVALGAAGVASLATGTVFGVVAKNRYDDADQNHCTPADCDARGIELTNDARSAATVSTALFVAGGVLGAAAVVVWLTAPPRESARLPAAALVVSPSSLLVRGTF